MAGKLIAENRRAKFDYFLEHTFEAGIALTGSEVKSLRNGKANIAESYAAVEGTEIVLVNADIPTYGIEGTFGDADDVRAHGRDERIGVKQFYEGLEFQYRLIKILSK